MLTFSHLFCYFQIVVIEVARKNVITWLQMLQRSRWDPCRPCQH